MSNALFGPDGTQLPEPETVLPDALVSPSGQDAFVLPPLPQLPPLPDADEVHRSFTDEFLATPPKGFPLPAAVPQPVPPPVPASGSDGPDQARRPAAGPRRPTRNAAPRNAGPAHRSAPARAAGPPARQPGPIASTPPEYPPPSRIPVYPPPGQRPPPPPGYQPGPGQFSPPYGGPPGAPPQQYPYAHRPREEPHNPLIQRSRRGSGGWVGCVVVLVFAVAVGFNAVQAIVSAVIDLLR